MQRHASGHGGRPAAAGQPERDDVAVADDDADLLERHAEFVGGDLGQRRLVALAVRHLAGEQHDDAVFLQPQAHGLKAHGTARPLGRARAGSGLDERSDTDAEVAALCSCLGLAAPERGKVHQLGDPLQ